MALGSALWRLIASLTTSLIASVVASRVASLTASPIASPIASLVASIVASIVARAVVRPVASLTASLITSLVDTRVASLTARLMVPWCCITPRIARRLRLLSDLLLLDETIPCLGGTAASSLVALLAARIHLLPPHLLPRSHREATFCHLMFASPLVSVQAELGEFSPGDGVCMGGLVCHEPHLLVVLRLCTQQRLDGRELAVKVDRICLEPLYNVSVRLAV